MRIPSARLFAAAGSALLLSFSGFAVAQGYPSKPIRFIVPYAPGGLPDSVARIVAQKLQESVGQPVVIDNKPGGNGAVAAAAMATTAADGYTFLVTDGSMITINPLIKKQLGYNPAKDFVPVSLIANSPLFLAVHPSVKANSFDELIALAKSKPGALNYGSSGIGSSHHLTAEAMKAATGTVITHIPFKGSGASVPALIGGQVEMAFAAYPSLSGFVKSGQVKILATNSLKRTSFAPNVPAISEKIRGFDFAVNVIMMAEAGTPADAVQKISAEVAKIVKRKDVVESLHAAGIEPIGGGPDALAKALQDESARMAKAVKIANVEPE